MSYGQEAYGTALYGAAPLLPASIPTSAPSATISSTNTRKAIEALAFEASQVVSKYGGPGFAATLNAIKDGCGPVFCSEQPADALATTTRSAAVFTAGVPCVLQEIAVVMDSDVVGMPDAYATFTASRYSSAGAASTALTSAASTVYGAAARTKLPLAWNGAFQLSAGDALVVEVAKAGAGVALPKFCIIGYGRLT